jgi:hypothetical protein
MGGRRRLDENDHDPSHTIIIGTNHHQLDIGGSSPGLSVSGNPKTFEPVSLSRPPRRTSSRGGRPRSLERRDPIRVGSGTSWTASGGPTRNGAFSRSASTSASSPRSEPPVPGISTDPSRGRAGRLLRPMAVRNGRAAAERRTVTPCCSAHSRTARAMTASIQWRSSPPPLVQVGTDRAELRAGLHVLDQRQPKRTMVRQLSGSVRAAPRHYGASS